MGLPKMIPLHDRLPPLQDVQELAESGAEDEMDVSEGDSPGPGRFRGRAHRGLAALGQDQQVGEDDADDFKAESGTEEDDEATLEEEEVPHLHFPCKVCRRECLVPT